MFDEPADPAPGRHAKPAVRAQDKLEELRLHAFMAALYEGPRKFSHELIPGLDATLARDVQRAMARFEKHKVGATALLAKTELPEAARILALPDGATPPLAWSAYHLHRRPGEVMVLRWLAGDEVDAFYDRLQAHFDAGLSGTLEDEAQAHGWKHDPDHEAYLKALSAHQPSLAERWQREVVRKHPGAYMLSTTAIDEMNIQYLAETLMGVAPEDLVGRAAAPASEATDRDLAWFFKAYILRGLPGGQERLCSFTFLQKAGDDIFDE